MKEKFRTMRSEEGIGFKSEIKVSSSDYVVILDLISNKIKNVCKEFWNWNSHCNLGILSSIIFSFSLENVIKKSDNNKIQNI